MSCTVAPGGSVHSVLVSQLRRPSATTPRPRLATRQPQQRRHNSGCVAVYVDKVDATPARVTDLQRLITDLNVPLDVSASISSARLQLAPTTTLRPRLHIS
jgi:hypothetical protein